MLNEKNRELSKHLEEVVLGSMLYNFDEERAVYLLTELSEKDFQYYVNAYQALRESIETKTGFGILMASKDIQISKLLEYKSSIANKEFYSAVRELKKVSLTIRYVENCATFIENSTPREIEQDIADLASKLNSVEFGIDRYTARDSIKEFDKLQEEYHKRYAKGELYLGMKTGFHEFDDAVEGIQDGKLYILGGTPGAGKTSIALNMVNDLLQQGKRILIFSLEMSSLEIIGKILGLRCNMNYLKILKGNLTDDQRVMVEEEKAKLYEQDLIIYDTMIDFDKVKLAIIKENLVKKIDFCMVDYLQLMGSLKYKTEFERMSAFPNELKVHICRKLNVPVMALSQINNESAKNLSDNMSGFKGSGAIEAAADVGLLLLYKEKREDRDLKKEQGLALNMDLIITKQRAGITKPITMSFLGKTGRFTEGAESTINSLVYQKK